MMMTTSLSLHLTQAFESTLFVPNEAVIQSDGCAGKGYCYCEGRTLLLPHHFPSIVTVILTALAECR
jgi:hypothetical protein